MKRIVLVMLVVCLLVAFTAPAMAKDTGFNDAGYNYNARIYNGDYAGDGSNLVMKWNDAWLSNKDRDEDGKLDRHWGFDSYIGSGAWCTNHWSGSYVDENGKVQHWTDFIKIVAVPADAVLMDGVWYTLDGLEIGETIWGQFAIVQEVYNDSGTGDHGNWYKAERPALGGW